MTKDQKQELRNKLVDFAVRLGYTVELDATMPEYLERAKEKGKETNPDGTFVKEPRPAGDCNYKEQRIRVREGKGVEGQVCTLIHELTHALGLGGNSWYTMLGEPYLELVCESVTQFVSMHVGIDRTHKTAPRVYNYGFNGFLATPVTQAITNVFCDELGYDRFDLPHITFEIIAKKVDQDGDNGGD